MSLQEPYNPDNIFAKIIRGEASATKIHETNDCLAFMDLFPQSDGHCLVIPKKAEAVNFLDIPQAELQTLIEETQRTARAVEKALSPDGLRIVQFNGAPAGQTVFHIHFHIIPIYEGAGLGAHAGDGPADAQHLEALAKKIAAAL